MQGGEPLGGCYTAACRPASVGVVHPDRRASGCAPVRGPQPVSLCVAGAGPLHQAPGTAVGSGAPEAAVPDARCRVSAARVPLLQPRITLVTVVTLINRNGRCTLRMLVISACTGVAVYVRQDHVRD